jgi:hypothetical protein
MYLKGSLQPLIQGQQVPAWEKEILILTFNFPTWFILRRSVSKLYSVEW